jgi:hypothetical protein
MPRSRLAPAVLAALVFALASGCGSDDDSKSRASGEPGAKNEHSTKPADKGSAAPKRSSARGKLVDCIEREGIDITPEGDDEAKATSYTVGPQSARRRKAVIKIHSNRGEASRSAERAGLDKGLNAVAFGRAEFIRYEATDNEAGRIVNCMSAAYGG